MMTMMVGNALAREYSHLLMLCVCVHACVVGVVMLYDLAHATSAKMNEYKLKKKVA